MFALPGADPVLVLADVDDDVARLSPTACS